jgi:biopolymer transport protein ExbD/biopolymer transport protein TolR
MAFHPIKPDGRPAPEINVTPLVDVVLVLLIIFMVMTPLLDRKFWVHVPRQEKELVQRKDLLNQRNPPLVLRLSADRRIQINGAQVEIEELPTRLARMFAAKDDHVLFFDAADDVPLGLAVEVMDMARDGGAITIATLTTSPAPME